MRADLQRWTGWLWLGAVLVACSSEAQHGSLLESTLEDPGTLRGQLAVQIADFDDGTTETRYFLRDAEGVHHRLVVRGTIDVAPGSTLRIRGVRGTNGAIDLASYELVPESTGRAQLQHDQPLLDDGGQTGSRVLCAGLVELNGAPGKTTLDQVSSAFYKSASSVNSFFLENSFGKFHLEGAAYGPFKYDMTGCDHMALAAAIRPMIDAQSPVKCDQYAFVFGPNVSECGWSAVTQFGTRQAPTTDTWFNDSVACVVAVQEPSHNYGQQHSSSIACSSGPFADDLGSCTHSEYGDKYDVMGGGCYHMNGWQKQFQGWFGGCNAVSTSSSGTFNLQPIELPCDGVQVLRLPFPLGKKRSFQDTTLTSYYLELRTASGFDAKIGTPRVFVHAGGDPPLPNQLNVTGLHTWILNTGATWGLGAGQSFTDPAGGLTIRVDAVDSSRATVNVDYAAGTGSPYCLDGLSTPFVPPGPEKCPGTGTGGTGGAGGTGGTGGGDVGGTGGIGVGGTGGTGGSGTGGVGTGGVGTGGVGTGGVGTGGVGTGGATGGDAGTGGSSGASGGTGGAGKGGAGSGGDAGNGGNGADPSGGTGGSRATGGSTGTGATGTGGNGTPDRDASPTSDAGNDDFGQDRPACNCTLPVRRGASTRLSAALLLLALLAAGRRKRQRSA